MVTILRAGPERIMNVFYNAQGGKIHLRNLSRKAGLNENSVSRFLKQLEGVFLRYEKEGNMKKYFICKGSRVYNVFSMFDSERFLKLPLARRRAIDGFLRELKEKPLIVVLFGSSAKGSFNESSDIDLLMIVNRRKDVSVQEEYIESQAGIDINSLQVTWKDFLKEIKNKEDSVVQSALQSGYPIQNSVLFYEEVLKWT